MKTARLLLLFTVFTVGLLSILATSSEPVPILYFYALTHNNYEADAFREQRQTFACQGEEVLLELGGFNGRRPRLSAEPLSSVSPTLQREIIIEGGSLPITILDETTLSLDFGTDITPSFSIKLLPSELCTGFDFPVVGWYEGELEQTTPEPSILKRQLRLIWTQEGEKTMLHAELADNLAKAQFLEHLDCLYQLSSPNLRCVSEENETLKLEMNVTENSLTGSYTGTGRSGLGFGGTLMMTKQKAAPAQQP